MQDNDPQHERGDASTGRTEAAAVQDTGDLPRRVVVFESDERLDVTVLEDALERAGLSPSTAKLVQDARTLFSVSVDESSAARARDVVAELLPDADKSEALQPVTVGLPGKRATLAWGLALFPGMAHFYVGAPIRGLLLLIALVSTPYWARFDHTIALAPLALLLADALGASALIAGHRKPVRTWLAVTAPLWVASPAVLLLYAPSVYIGASGRALCEDATGCGVAFEPGECAMRLAEQVGYSIRHRRAISECARFLESRTCDEAYGPEEDGQCWTRPMCAAANSEGEEACVNVYYGLPEEDSTPALRHSQPRGWGM